MDDAEICYVVCPFYIYSENRYRGKVHVGKGVSSLLAI